MNILRTLIIKKGTVLMEFKIIAEKWLEYKKMNIKKSTYSNYEYVINKYLIPYLGEKKFFNFNDMILMN